MIFCVLSQCLFLAPQKSCICVQVCVCLLQNNCLLFVRVFLPWNSRLISEIQKISERNPEIKKHCLNTQMWLWKYYLMIRQKEDEVQVLRSIVIIWSWDGFLDAKVYFLNSAFSQPYWMMIHNFINWIQVPDELFSFF